MRSFNSLIFVRKSDVVNDCNNCDSDDSDTVSKKKLQEIDKKSWDPGDTNVFMLSKEDALELEHNATVDDLLGACGR